MIPTSPSPSTKLRGEDSDISWALASFSRSLFLLTLALAGTLTKRTKSLSKCPFVTGVFLVPKSTGERAWLTLVVVLKITGRYSSSEMRYASATMSFASAGVEGSTMGSRDRCE